MYCKRSITTQTMCPCAIALSPTRRNPAVAAVLYHATTTTKIVARFVSGEQIVLFREALGHTAAGQPDAVACIRNIHAASRGQVADGDFVFKMTPAPVGSAVSAPLCAIHTPRQATQCAEQDMSQRNVHVLQAPS